MTFVLPKARPRDLVAAEWIKITSPRSTYFMLLAAVVTALAIGMLVPPAPRDLAEPSGRGAGSHRSRAVPSGGCADRPGTRRAHQERGVGRWRSSSPCCS